MFKAANPTNKVSVRKIIPSFVGAVLAHLSLPSLNGFIFYIVGAILVIAHLYNDCFILGEHEVRPYKFYATFLQKML